MLSLPEVELVGQRPPLDERSMQRRIGLIILATDHTTEPDFRRMVASEQVGVYVSRIPYANPTTPQNLLKMRPVLTNGAGLILPNEQLDAICYSCTAASVVIGDDEVRGAIQAAKPHVPVVTPPEFAVRGLHALGARRIGLLTRTRPKRQSLLVRYFAKRGFEIARVLCLGFEDDREMALIAPTSLIDLARRATPPDADALFVSCTGLRVAAIAPTIEATIDRPVVSSNLEPLGPVLGYAEITPFVRSGAV